MTDVRGSTLRLPGAIRPNDRVYVHTTLPAAACLCLCVSGTIGAVTVGTDANR
jgi:hypothetical protein